MPTVRWWETLDDGPRYRQWFAGRPPIVQSLLTEFPLGTPVTIPGEGSNWFVFGATEGGWLIIAPKGAKSYEQAMKKRRHLCANCLRRDEIHFVTKQ